jgi:UDP-3-O-[3-hydroxymyristoyl] glucosamine N-acyltransferase
LKLKEIAEKLGCRLEGDGDIEIRRVAGIETAGPGDLTFFANPRYTDALRATSADAVILGESGDVPCAALRTPNPYLAFAEAVRLFHQEAAPPPGVDRLASIAPDVRLGEGVTIGPFVAIACGTSIGARSVIHPNVSIARDVLVGEDCIIYSNVAIRERSRLGHRVIVQNGAVIGADGFGFARRPDGTHQKIPQAGCVVIEDDVEIGANAAVDRPALGETRIQAGAKIDNLVQIAHGVTIGRRALLAAQVGIAGSTIIEEDVVLAGQVGVAGHIRIGRGATATAQSGIPNSVAAGALVSGYPAIDNREWLKSAAVFRRLPELKRALADLERRLAQIEANRR